MSDTNKPLPVPGPDASKKYIVRTPPLEDVSKAGDMVTVEVQYASSQAPLILTYVLGASQALPWLDHITTGLNPGSSATLHVEGADESILSVLLKSFTRPEPKSLADIAEEANALREEGNKIFKESANNFGGYRKAVDTYVNALDRHRRVAPNPKIQAKIHSNIALTYIKTCQWIPAIAHCDAAIAYAGIDPKFLYRRAMAQVEMDHGTRALADLHHADSLSPDDPLIKRELMHVNRQYLDVMPKRRDQFAEMYSVMMRSPIFTSPIIE